MQYASVGVVAVLFALVCAKWAMELGFGQFRQLLWGIAGLFFGPLIAVILYARLIRKAIAEGLPSGKW